MQRPPELSTSLLNQPGRTSQLSGKASLALNSLISPTYIRKSNNSVSINSNGMFSTPALQMVSPRLDLSNNMSPNTMFPHRASNFPPIVSPRGPSTQWPTTQNYELPSSYNHPLMQQKPMFNPSQNGSEDKSKMYRGSPLFNVNHNTDPGLVSPMISPQNRERTFNFQLGNISMNKSRDINNSIMQSGPNFLGSLSSPTTSREPLNNHSSYILKTSAQEILKPEASFMHQQPSLGKPHHSREPSLEKSFAAPIWQMNSIKHETSGFNISLRTKTDSMPGGDDKSVMHKPRLKLPADKLMGLPQYQNLPSPGIVRDGEMLALQQRLNKVEQKPLLRVPTPTGNKKFAFSMPPSKLPSTTATPQKQSLEPSPVPSMSILNNPEKTPRKKESENEIKEPESPKRVRNPQAKIWLKTWLWVMVAPSLLRSDIERAAIEKRNKINLKAPETVKAQVNHAAKFIKDHSFKALEELYKLTGSINFLTSNKKSRFAKSSKKNADARNKQISTHLLAILQEFSQTLSKKKLPAALLEYLASISENLTRIPSGFLFEFELVRLEFSQFVALKNMNPERSQMVIGMFVLVRMLVFYFLTQPWTATKKVEESALLVENLKICSSILYQIIMMHFRKSLPIIPNNQGSIVPEKRLNPRKGPLTAFADKDQKDEPGETTGLKTDDIIVGLYSQKELEEYFTGEQEAVESMTTIIEQCLQTLYTKVHEVNIDVHKME